MTTFHWLHLTDLHQGLAPLKWLWPNVEQRVYEDLTKLHKLCGPWDLVLFTGDLTQSGSREEFQALNATLSKLWNHLKELGSNPSLLMVPGNHDLVRPNQTASDMIVLTKWQGNSTIHEEFCRDKRSSYRKMIQKVFKEYSDWVTAHPFPKPVALKSGLLPGDFSATVEKEGKKVGIVGLNSAYLQLGPANFEGRLNLGYEQLHEVCDGKVIEWIDAHDVSLLMTHHPPEWLSKEAKQRLNAEIAPPERFAVHLFGHMHEHATRSLSVGGASQWRWWQGNSLFGLEHWGEAKKVARSHGYAAGRIEITETNAMLRMWPRKAYKHQAGYWQLGPDQSFTLLEDQGTTAEAISLRRAIKDAKRQAPADETELIGLITDAINNTGHPSFTINLDDEKRVNIAIYTMAGTNSERQREVLSIASIFRFETDLIREINLFLIQQTPPTDNPVTFDPVLLACSFALEQARSRSAAKISEKEFWEQIRFWVPQMPGTVYQINLPIKIQYLGF